MALDRAPKWDQYRGIFLKLGLSAAIGLSITVLNIESAVKEIKPFAVETEEPFIVEDIERTVHKKKEIKRPKAKPKQKRAEEIKKIIEEIVTEEKQTETQDTIVYEEPDLDYFTADVSPEPAPFVEPEPELESEEPIRFADQMPIFGDCDQEDYQERRKCSDRSLLGYISKHLKYPAVARENDVTGTVVITFVVSKYGEIINLEVVRDIGAGCGAAAKKVIESLPSWKPGKQNGRPVNVYYTLPVRFSLE